MRSRSRALLEGAEERSTSARRDKRDGTTRAFVSRRGCVHARAGQRMARRARGGDWSSRWPVAADADLPRRGDPRHRLLPRGVLSRPDDDVGADRAALVRLPGRSFDDRRGRRRQRGVRRSPDAHRRALHSGVPRDGAVTTAAWQPRGRRGDDEQRGGEGGGGEDLGAKTTR